MTINGSIVDSLRLGKEAENVMPADEGGQQWTFELKAILAEHGEWFAVMRHPDGQETRLCVGDKLVAKVTYD
jgi:hypothetical protein